MEPTTPQPAQANNANAYEIRKSWPITLGIIALLGFLDASYLTVKHYLGTPLPCSILHGCEVVTTSVYSTVAGIPIALFGALYYLTLLILVIVYFDTKKPWALKAATVLTIAGFVVTLVLVYLQLFVLHAICLYCMFSATTSTLLFIIAMTLISKMRRSALA